MKKILFSSLASIVLLGAVALFSSYVPQVHAYWIKDAFDMSCSKDGYDLTVHVSPTTETACTTNQYQSAVQIKAEDNSHGAYQVHWRWASYWCSDPSVNNGQVTPCTDNPSYADSTPATQGLTGDGSGTVVATSLSYSSQGQYAGQVCGRFQNDLSFYITPNDNPNDILCGITGASFTNPGTPIGVHGQNTGTLCSTGVTCTSNTPTPTPTTVPPTPTPTSTVCTTPPTCSTPPDGCSYQGGDACTCGQLVCITHVPGCTGSDCNITVNVTNNNSNSQSQSQNQQQQQQQQMVLAATVAPAATTTNLPSTGAGFEVLGTLFALIPAGFKLRKLV